MKVTKVKNKRSSTPVTTLDCFVDRGYIQGEAGSLPDVDNDFEALRLQDVRKYIEDRYNSNNKTRVFMAGTFTTMKIKAVIKDVARVHRTPVSIVNYMTAIIKKEDEGCSWSDFMKLAAREKKLAKFINDYPQVFEEIRTLMFQPRSTSVHASAQLITPAEKDGESMECFDFTPIKKVDGQLLSEFSGYDLDECGLLKNDSLSTKELSKLHQVLDLCNEIYGTDLSLEKLARSNCDDSRVFELLSKGYTQNVFQLSSKGMTKFIMNLAPQNIDDLIAANALFRPATLDSGSADAYIDRKKGDVAPTYLWGTYEAMKNTYGVLCFQEQLMQIALKVGNFTLGEGYKLIKFISKKKQAKINAMRDKFLAGAAENGCPKEDADAIWELFENAGSYCFNKSHATAYGVTAYAGAYLKAYYPTPFYTIALQWADDAELVTLMGEMEACSDAKVVPPDINVSELDFHANYETNEIFWSLTRIKQLGAKGVEWIVNERNKNGEFTSIDNFIDRIFKYKFKHYQYWDDPDNEDEYQKCPINARHVRNLILAGCFDRIENAQSVVERYAIIEKAAKKLGFEITEKDFPLELRGKHYFWSQKQIEVSGIGAIDYERIYQNCELKPKLKGKAKYATLAQISEPEREEEKVIVCATVAELEEKKFDSKKTGKTETFCKITLQQNNETCELVVWPEEYARFYGQLRQAKNRLIVFNGYVKYSDYSGKNEVCLNKRSLLEVL